jgi:hypothetical protein
MKKIFTTAFFIMGMFLLCFGVVMLTENEVSCGGHAPSEGAECVQYKDGVEVGTNALADQKASDRRYGYGGIVVGLVLIGAGGVQIRKFVSDKAQVPAA